MRYSLWYEAGCELGHFLFGCCVSLAVALLACLLIWITYRIIFSALAGYPCRLTSSTLARAGFFILLCSLSAALFLHVLEDYYLGWF
jgi:hypothetical protein